MSQGIGVILQQCCLEFASKNPFCMVQANELALLRCWYRSGARRKWFRATFRSDDLSGLGELWNSLISRGPKLVVGSRCQTLQVTRTFKIAAFAILILMGILLGRMIFSPYTVWYFVIPSARLTVDGRLEQGWIHRANHGKNLFLTRRKNGKAESYSIALSHDVQGSVSSCGNWTAPRFPVFPIGDLNPPCWTVYAAEDLTPRANFPVRRLATGEHFVEFTADDGSRIKGSW